MYYEESPEIFCPFQEKLRKRHVWIKRLPVLNSYELWILEMSGGRVFILCRAQETTRKAFTLSRHKQDLSIVGVVQGHSSAIVGLNTIGQNYGMEKNVSSQLAVWVAPPSG